MKFVFLFSSITLALVEYKKFNIMYSRKKK